MYRVSIKYGFVGRSTGEGNVQLDVYPVAGLYEATHCIAHILKAEM